MRRQLSYEDAVRILGGGERKLMKYLDRASAVSLVAVGGFNFFDMRETFVRLGGELITKLSERLRGIDRLTRTERLMAAHTVIVTTAYFDALGDSADALVSIHPPQITADDELLLVAGQPWQAAGRAFIESLVNPGPLQPSPIIAHEQMLDHLVGYYRSLGRIVAGFVTHNVDSAQREAFYVHLMEVVPALAVTKYDELSQRLAVDCPEYAVWVGLTEHRATRDEVRAGLTVLEGLLGQIANGSVPDARRIALSRAYQAALDKPITVGGDLAADLQIPTLGEGYIDHRVRVAPTLGPANTGRESFWTDIPTRDDIHGFIAAYLSSPEAYQAPLLVLGQPGSGKSVLTRVLATRLPATDFLPVRVELRQVPAEADLQDQIELAVRQATGENISWPRLVESASGALPVILLDGFDELLQTTGVSQTDFLIKVAAFQEREADQGRPVAVIVTSRIAVANRAALPPNAIVLRLEPFDDDQVAAWLEVWRRTNEPALARRGLRALPVDCALQHRELAQQPLLLLMLALHDANANALQLGSGRLSRTELYEQLLTDFARREVVKQLRGLTSAELELAVETELLRLAVVAFSMFNRRTQWVSESDLNQDLAALLGNRVDTRHPSGFREPLTAAQIVVGRFFFVHEAKATRDGQQLQTYEFLHATFGEFLVARLAAQVLTDLVERETAATSRLLPGGIDDGLLHALLSFAGLAARAPVVTFLNELLNRLTKPQLAATKDLLLRLHRTALGARPDSAYAAYEPGDRPLADRLAVWSSNLVLLAVLVSDEVMGSELFPDTPDVVAHRWRDEAMMWRARLTAEEWSGLIGTIGMERLWAGEHRDVRLLLDDGTFAPEPPDLRWTYDVSPDGSRAITPIKWAGHVPGRIGAKGNFTTSKSGDMLSHALVPIGEAFPSIANVLIPLRSGRLVSPTHALLAALIQPVVPQGDSKLSTYSDLVDVVEWMFVTNAVDAESLAFLKTAMGVLWLAKHQGHLPEATFDELDRLAKDIP